MKSNDVILVYDHSFNGFLSCVYYAFKEKVNISDIKSVRNIQGSLFSDNIYIETDVSHARSVWFTVQRKNYNAIKNIYFAFLSESFGIEFILYNYLKRIFAKNYISNSYNSDESYKKIVQLAKLVGHEKRRLEHEIDLNPTAKEMQVTYIEPAFNLIPLVTKHLRSQFKEHPWLLFDLKRKYGVGYDGYKLSFVSADQMKVYKERYDHLLTINKSLPEQKLTRDRRRQVRKADNHRTEESMFSAA